MLTVLSCIATGHDLRYVALAAFICTIGSALSMRLFARIRRTDGARRLHWLFLAGLVAGGTIWATHFAAMLGYDIPLGRSFEPFLTKVSLGIAVAFSLVGLWIAGRAGNGWGIELGGAVLGAGIVTMHYTGMAAMQVPGVIQWDKGLIAWSVFFGVGFGTLTTSRISRPITRFCKYGATASMVLAICAMHFTGMGAATVVPLPGIPVPAQAISDGVLLMTVVAVLLVIMATAASAYTIDLHGAREASERYKHLALHDPLTGLANRNHLAIRLDEMLSGSVDDPGRLAVVGLDLDRFKDVNDVHGHAAGDALLREIAQRAALAIGSDAFLARIGGDEFIAVKRDVFTRKEAVQFAESLRDAITAPIAWKGNAVAVGCSIGIAMYPDDGRDAETLTARADLAVYRAKSLGRNKIRIFEPGMDEESRSRAALAIDLRRALEEGQFELHYQPQNDAVSRKIVGFEALLRWNHPERGRIPPDAFIPIAEETGLIIDIGDWVLRTACLEAASWSQPYRVAVNVAPLQLAQGSLPERVADTLKATGLDSERLEIELTESGIISDQQHALHVIRSLKALGVTVAMDDFGTGYSSLSTLQNFPFDKIKIDRGFVHSVGQDAQAAAIVKATILLGTSLNIPVLAEGVETEDHLAFLREQGCTTVQGYLFGLPRPASEIPALMDKSEIALYRTTDSGEEMSREARRKSA